MSSFPLFVQALWSDVSAYERLEAQKTALAALRARGRDESAVSFTEAVIDGDTTSVELFVKAGFPPDTRDRKNIPVLNLAVRNHHFGVVKVLLEQGAPLDVLSPDRHNTAVMDASAEGDLDILGLLLDRGADLEQVSRDGQTALILAVGKGADDVALELLRRGANPYVEDKLGMNALKYAQLFGRKAVLELIPPARQKE